MWINYVDNLFIVDKYAEGEGNPSPYDSNTIIIESKPILTNWL